MLEKLNKATPINLQVWMLSAGVVGFGLGLWFADYLKPYAQYILLIGVIAHLSAMYNIYKK